MRKDGKIEEKQCAGDPRLAIMSWLKVYIGDSYFVVCNCINGWMRGRESSNPSPTLPKKEPRVSFLKQWMLSKRERSISTLKCLKKRKNEK